MRIPFFLFESNSVLNTDYNQYNVRKHINFVEIEICRVVNFEFAGWA